MAQSLDPRYRTALHEALLIKIKERNSAAAADGFLLVEDEILQLIINSRDLSDVKKQLFNQVYVLKAAEIVDTEEQSKEVKDLHQSYIKLGLLLSILNRYILTADTSIFQFDLTTSENRYRTIDGHLSVDPEVCLLPSTLQSLLDKQEGFDTPLVYNILINVDFIARVLNSHLDSQGNILLLDFFEDLFVDIERVTGNINKYELQYYEQSNSFTVLDRNFLKNEPKANLPEIDVFGLRSVVSSVNLVSQISSKMSSMVAISAQDSPFSSNMESTGFAALNKDLINRQEGKVKDLTKEELLEIKEQKELTYDELLKKFETDMGTLIYHLNSVYGLKLFNLSDAYYVSNIYENYCSMVIGKKNDPAYSFIIPFQLDLTLDGISGVKVLNSFRINKNILPSTYGGRTGVDVAFLVTGVEHTIDTKAWKTNLKTQIYNVNDKGTVNDGKNYRAYWPTLVSPGITPGNGGTGGNNFQNASEYYYGSVKATLQETEAFLTDVLKGFGITSPNSYQLQFMKIWKQSERSQAAWNPLNTTLDRQGATPHNDAGKTFVRNYTSREQGLEATISTFTQGGGPKRYGALIQAIKNAKNEAGVDVAMQALHDSAWGTKFNPVKASSYKTFNNLLYKTPIAKRT